MEEDRRKVGLGWISLPFPRLFPRNTTLDSIMIDQQAPVIHSMFM